MKRTTISIDDPLLRELHRMADERRISVAALVREAVEEKLATFRTRPRSLGIGASGQTNTARLAGEERAEPRAWR